MIFGNLPKLPATIFVCPGNEEERANLALAIDRAVRDHAPAGWRGDAVREREVKNVLFPLLGRDRDATPALFEIVRNQAGY